ncbi:hypothetical protein Agub_g11050, partial [Astrephomene gubernaculifera]
WSEVRKLMSPPLFELFNLVFVALAQHLLCMLITAPAFVAHVINKTTAATAARSDSINISTSSSSSTSGSGHAAPLTAADWAAAACFAVLLAGEAAADQQQWVFQRRKRQLLEGRQRREGDYRRGFLSSSWLFRFSRHPSFFCEYGMWWAFYALCAALPARCALHWSAAGAVGLTLLFHGGSV